MKRLRITVNNRVYDVAVEVVEDDEQKAASGAYLSPLPPAAAAPRPVVAPEGAVPGGQPSDMALFAPEPAVVATPTRRSFAAAPPPAAAPPAPPPETPVSAHATDVVPPSAPGPTPAATAAPSSPEPLPAPASAAPPAEAPPPARHRSEPRRTETHVVVAPVAGTVKKVFVEPGAIIDTKSPVVLLDAMMMDTPVYAPTGGQVAVVAVAPGRVVQAGDPLIRYVG